MMAKIHTAAKCLVIAGGLLVWATSAHAQLELPKKLQAERVVKALMAHSFTNTPRKFTDRDGTTYFILAKKVDDLGLSLDFARETMRVAWQSAWAKECKLPFEQYENHRSFMIRQLQSKKWSAQQLIFMHFLLIHSENYYTGRTKAQYYESGRVVKRDPIVSKCTNEQRAQVKAAIESYVKSGPSVKLKPGTPMINDKDLQAKAQAELAKIKAQQAAAKKAGAVTPASAKK